MLGLHRAYPSKSSSAKEQDLQCGERDVERLARAHGLEGEFFVRPVVAADIHGDPLDSDEFFDDPGFVGGQFSG